MNLLWALWEIFVNFIEYFFLYYLLAKQLGVPSAKKVQARWGLVLLIAMISIMNLCNIDYMIPMVLLSILKVVYALLLFGSNLVKRLFWGCIGAFVAVMGNSLISIILSWLTHVDIAGTLLPGETRFATTILYCFIEICICWGLSRIQHKAKLDLPIGYQILMFVIMMLGLIATAVMISYSIQATQMTSSDRILLTVVSAALLVITLASLYLFERAGKAIYEKIHAESQLAQLRLERDNNQRIEEIIKLWRHDFHNYLEVLQIYLEKQDYEQLKKYIGETRQDFQYALSLVATGNSAVDAILSSKLLIASSKDIPVKFTISQLRHLPLSETKMCVLLGNLLDNSIESCSKMTDPQNRYIQISIKIQRGMCHICIENSATGDYHYTGEGQLISDKESKDHGFGLARVQQIVGEANGIYTISPQPDKFIVSILLPINEEEIYDH